MAARHPSDSFAFLLTLLLALVAWGCSPDYEVGREGAGEGVEAEQEAAPETAEEDALPARIPTADGPEDGADTDRTSPPGQGEGAAQAGAGADPGPDETPETVRSGAGAGALPGSSGPQRTEPSAAGSRGRYITHRLALCIECHTPRDREGNLLLDRKFEGAPIPFQGAFGREWALEAPAIAGMRMYTREQAVRLLTEGVGRNGRPLRPPMPAFRMTEEDARAVYEYLSRLGG